MCEVKLKKYYVSIYLKLNAKYNLYLFRNNLNDIKIRAGSTKTMQGDLIDVDRIVMHELHYDIAMLQIKNKLEFSETVQPIRLAEANALFPSDGSDVLVLGWGIFQVFFYL